MYKNGDKVRVIEDARFCETIKKGDIVEIDRVEYGVCYVKGHIFNDGSEDQYWMRGSEFELFEGDGESDKKYVWYLDSEDSVYFLNVCTEVVRLNKNHYTTEIEKTKNGEYVGYLLTEEQVKQSPFFDKFKKHDPFEEKLYYILVKGQDWEDRQFLNLEVESSRYFFDNDVETDGFKITFTEKEADEIIGTSSILYKEEC